MQEIKYRYTSYPHSAIIKTHSTVRQQAKNLFTATNEAVKCVHLKNIDAYSDRAVAAGFSTYTHKHTNSVTGGPIGGGLRTARKLRLHTSQL